jgi:hypothetical protein
VGGDAGLVAGGGGEVGHVLVGGHLLLLLNCCQILEHHLLNRYEIFFPMHALACYQQQPLAQLVCGWMKMTDQLARMQAQAQQDQISRAGGPIMHVQPWWYLQLRPDQLVLVLLRQRWGLAGDGTSLATTLES